ncbi:MAG TPA: galactosamine-6-phosphate isomerase [Puia sp.]|nr:galactosamine-6-phosphate isomerase [Puia sp.]
MEIHRHDSYETLSREAASLILNKIKQKNNAVLCAATGNSPTKTYALLKQSFDHQPGLFSNLMIIKLDEWGGVPMQDPGTCESYLQSHLIEPLKIGGDRYISFNSNPDNTVEECFRIQEKLNEIGPIDICILGLGLNGHLALNEPGEFLEANVHVAKLSESSLTHSMIGNMKMKPSYGLTLGMADILQSEFVIIIVSGTGKKKITADFLNGNISTKLPASFLWLHPNTICLIDKEAYL